MNIQSNVSSRQRPDAPATFESLNDDTLTTTLQFVGDKSYKSFGGTNKRCREIYLNTPGMTKETYLYGYAPLSVIIDKIERAGYGWELYQRVGKGVVCFNRRDILDKLLEEQNKNLLKGICKIAAKEGRIDILNKVLNNVNDEDDKRFIFEVVGERAGQNGKLNVLKWLKTKGLSIYEERCAHEAAWYGQLHILQWLREEQGLELDGHLYYQSIKGGQLHVMKWLREKEVDWDDCTFHEAALEGDFDILQWLHDEGCPWPDEDDDRVHEYDLKLGVVDWCRTNGYSDRLYRD